MIVSFNRVLQRLMPYITPSAVVIGVLLAKWFDNFVFLVPWIFAVMTFAGSLGSNFTDLKKVLRHPVALVACIVLLHIIMPLIALGVGSLLFGKEDYTTIGLVLSFVIPTGITSLIWVSIYKGNVVLTLSIILIDTLLAPFTVPLVMQLLVGGSVQMDIGDIMVGLLFMIVIPSLAGMAVNQWGRASFTSKMETNLAPLTKIGIGLVVTINSSAIAPYLRVIDQTLVWTGVTVLCLAALSYVLGFWTGRLLRVERGSVLSLTFNSGMRNISGGAVIAITYFPPPVAVPVIVGMLFQQVLASFAGKRLDNFGKGDKGVAALTHKQI
ncbi:bile acid:sodium symporter family protein [Bacillus sp. SB49]|uniref:bile acid:sodium symporter family protein n=1 Tax=Bacillus sp. SB49 TaxID=1071080 RepID=UPI000417EB26|nr:bile acid:sodium symporter family protein [Bacillus sp. SB49]QHT45824.1 bile acid:sodium symporter family protein [Bacillus sp. SB49]